ncbi:hypothetical protein JCM14469_43750 [Desulfatiferula olefinivorans]
MKIINRTALLFQPKQPFIDWLNQHETSEYVYKLNERRNDGSLFLIEEVKNIDEIKTLIEDKFEYFFKFELDKYPFGRESWPNTNNFETFVNWIDFTYHTIVEDMCDAPIKWESF